MVSTFEFSNQVVGIMIDKDISREYMDEVHEVILEKIKQFGVISLFCEVQSGNKIPFELMINELKFKFQNSKNIKKLALVTNVSWLRATMDISELLLSSEIKTFEIEDRLDAMDWISH